MSDYTAELWASLDNISWEDDNFMQELIDVWELFRPFSEAMDAFLRSRGYAGDISDTQDKVRFIREAFTAAGIQPPREIREWFADQPIRRETAFQICFAFHLDGDGTDEFFRRIYVRERSFNCHIMQEAVWYFCLNNDLGWADAQDVLSLVQPVKADPDCGEVVYTSAIIAELNALESKEELIDWLRKNTSKFVGNNVSAYEAIRRLWAQTAGPEGLLLRERRVGLPSFLDDCATGKKKDLRATRTWDVVLGILQLDKKDVGKLNADRSLKPILGKLHAAVQASFPDRQGIDRILRGEQVSYERVRKWLVLLTFYTHWANLAVERRSYTAEQGDGVRCISVMNRCLLEVGYPELYVGNPYDWIFFYAAKHEEPLCAFRYIWGELLCDALENPVPETSGL